MSFYLLLVIFHFLVIYLYILYLFVIILFSSGQDCGLLRPPPNGWIFGSKTTHPHSVIFSCGVGFTLDGSSERTCLRNGSWSGQQPKCRRKTMIDSLLSVIMIFVIHLRSDCMRERVPLQLLQVADVFFFLLTVIAKAPNMTCLKKYI